MRGTGAEYLEAPVSGSKAPAEQGTLIFLAGGDCALFERAGPLLDAMGKAKFFLGEARALPLPAKRTIPSFPHAGRLRQMIRSSGPAQARSMRVWSLVQGQMLHCQMIRSCPGQVDESVVSCTGADASCRKVAR